jgi:hypothetical protein
MDSEPTGHSGSGAQSDQLRVIPAARITRRALLGGASTAMAAAAAAWIAPEIFIAKPAAGATLSGVSPATGGEVATGAGSTSPGSFPTTASEPTGPREPPNSFRTSKYRAQPRARCPVGCGTRRRGLGRCSIGPADNRRGPPTRASEPTRPGVRTQQLEPWMERGEAHPGRFLPPRRHRLTSDGRSDFASTEHQIPTLTSHRSRRR